MSDPKERTLVLEQGRTLRQPFRIRVAQTGAVLDPPVAGYTTARLQVRTETDGDLLLDLSTANGGIVLGQYDDGTGTFWSGYLYASATAMGALVPWGDAAYDLVAIHTGGDVDTVSRGPCVLIPEVSDLLASLTIANSYGVRRAFPAPVSPAPRRPRSPMTWRRSRRLPTSSRPRAPR